MKRGFKKWAEDEAIRRRNDAGLAADAPLPARLLGNMLKISTLTPEDLGTDVRTIQILVRGDKSGWSAITIYPNGSPLVIYNPSHAIVRQETDLMHEFSHIICSHPPGKIVEKGDYAFAFREYNQGHEEEADWLAGALKVPREALLRLAGDGCSTEEIASHFQCSVPLARMRRNRTGVDLQIARRYRDPVH